MDMNKLWKVVQRHFESFNYTGGFNIVTYETNEKVLNKDFSFDVAQCICESHNRCILNLMGVNNE